MGTAAAIVLIAAVAMFDRRDIFRFIAGNSPGDVGASWYPFWAAGIMGLAAVGIAIRAAVSPQPTGVVTNVLVAALLGIALGVAGVLLEDYIDITVRGIEDAERRLELPVLGAVPDLGGGVPPLVLQPASSGPGKGQSGASR